MDKQTVVLASGNAGKLKELNRTLTPLGLELKSQAELDVPEVAEDGLSFVENAIIKARAACRHSGLPAVADDSGLEVDHLKGAPGIHLYILNRAGPASTLMEKLQAIGFYK